MKKSNTMMFVLGSSLATLLLTSSPALQADEVVSLRGGVDIAQLSLVPSRKNRFKDADPFERTWKEQPPVMPHKDYPVSIKDNKCMDCHSDENYEEEEATQIGRSHFVDRAGNKLENLSGNRFFCNQCHTPQFRIDPLVTNDFSTSARR
ncbi:MAG: nitrate reductase cytochrome c-type subunit; periplasmic nitrate reductase electron transfer subunit [Gammaproteobacteria bacterium]|jgi:cytochrome c-type protein NapB|nr:nitrate reductase cytochrome c-type subunit; periplasmic nitrate reductase electron transfer subunit [Gammaproteobacteria bacterium]MBT3489921.1 nitrate reductase cytochrome c-type subunit; periplasmic nitrate reductase electron transfer subunit [Gammaproteobacteria bacterium]MBT3718846.1 nitrate reductase cytochrome c-type subunit; periplasmic nitrate reductase electron transfer subunit [Gammaproteobacteria bacterium]MBT3843755.1 nitrate reductase cytochrome c-type subunit; periplasmic nitra